MKVHMKLKMMVLSLACWFFGASAFGQSMVVAKKDSVTVTAEPSKDGKVLKSLAKGTPMEALERKGMFWKVKVDGVEGFVSVMSVERQQGGEGGSIAKAIQNAAAEGREKEDASNGQRARSAVMGVRGLDETEETAGAGNVKPNLRMVYLMEDRMVSTKKLKSLEDMVMKEVETLATKRESQKD